MLVWVSRDVLLSLLLFVRWVDQWRGLVVGETELGKVAPGLLRDLEDLGVADAYPEHSRVGILRMEDVLDVSLELEEVVLAKEKALSLQVDGLFDNFLQILLHFFVALFL